MAGSARGRLDVEIERLEDLRAQLGVAGTGLAQRLLDPFQRLLVALEQLHLELVEAARDLLILEHRHAVVHDLGAVRADAGAPRAQARDGHELVAAHVGAQHPEQLVRRRSRTAGHLELEPREPARELQLPETLPVLDPVAQRDAVLGEPVRPCVVVGRDEDARLERVAAQLGQLEGAVGLQLHLAFEVSADPRHRPSVGASAVTRW